MKKHAVVFCVRNSEADMIDLERLKPILEGYKAYFPSHWDDEKYKWEVIKHFQDHWDITDDLRKNWILHQSNILLTLG